MELSSWIVLKAIGWIDVLSEKWVQDKNLKNEEPQCFDVGEGTSEGAARKLKGRLEQSRVREQVRRRQTRGLSGL